MVESLRDFWRVLETDGLAPQQSGIGVCRLLRRYWRFLVAGIGVPQSSREDPVSDLVGCLDCWEWPWGSPKGENVVAFARPVGGTRSSHSGHVAGTRH